MTDWPSLTGRFEAATDDDIYECVRELLHGVTFKRSGRFRLGLTITEAEDAGMPDLLLGVVVACVPEGWIISAYYDGSVRANAMTTACELRHVRGGVGVGRSVKAIADTRPAALGAAVCRAWESVGKGDVG